MLRRILPLLLVAGTAAAQPVAVTVTLTNANRSLADSLYLVDLAGTETQILARTKLSTSAPMTLQATVPGVGYYSLLLGAGGAQPKALAIILGDAPTLRITADALNFERNPRFDGSPRNTEAQDVLALISDLTDNRDRYGEAVVTRRRDSLYAKYGTDPGPIGNFVRLYHFPGLDQLPAGHGYRDEADYFLRGFFANDRLEDPAFAYTYQLMDKASGYAQIVSRLDITPEAQLAALDNVRKRAPAGSRTRRLLLEGYLQAVESNPDLMGHVAAWYLADFPNSKLKGPLTELIAKYDALKVGKPAPDIQLATPTGETKALSSLRGNIVLIDFWASWCGPCRRENPNVVKLYNRFKDKGFTIYGVSLDRDRDDWLKAIADDKLTWHHVSDLKYWQSAGARLYNVSSIPATVLLDREGRIVARNLRGEALEAKVAELLGVKP